jgi:simple sugar transport system permease protein
MTPLLFAAAGGLFTELAGTLNIALEGLLLMGAFSAAAAAYYTGSLLAGFFAGIAGALILSAALAAVTLNLKSNVFITGLAVNLFASGFTVILSNRLFGTRGVVVLKDLPRFTTVTIPLVKDIPFAGPLLSGHSVYVYGGLVFLFLTWFILHKTPFGFRLRACGINPRALASLGVRPDACRFAAFLASGLACGIGGSFLSLNLGAFVPNISSGRGWIALVVIYLGARRPWGLLLAAFIFALADAFSNYAQGAFDVPSDFILALPYIFTFIVMAAASALQFRIRK